MFLRNDTEYLKPIFSTLCAFYVLQIFEYTFSLAALGGSLGELIPELQDVEKFLRTFRFRSANLYLEGTERALASGGRKSERKCQPWPPHRHAG